MDAKHFTILLLMFVTLLILTAGIVLMMLGGKLNAKYGNKLMVARVACQGLTIVLIGLMFAIGK